MGESQPRAAIGGRRLFISARRTALAAGPDDVRRLGAPFGRAVPTAILAPELSTFNGLRHLLVTGANSRARTCTIFNSQLRDVMISVTCGRRGSAFNLGCAVLPGNLPRLRLLVPTSTPDPGSCAAANSGYFDLRDDLPSPPSGASFATPRDEHRAG